MPSAQGREITPKEPVGRSTDIASAQGTGSAECSKQVKGHRKRNAKCLGQGGRLHAEQGRLPVSSTASRAPQLLSKLWPIHCGPPRRAGGGVTNYRLPTHLVGVWATVAAPAPPATCAASSGRLVGSVARGRRPTPRVPRERREQPG